MEENSLKCWKSLKVNLYSFSFNSLLLIFFKCLFVFSGRNGRFRCNLCNCCFGECDIEAHCKGKYHRMNYNSHIERSGGSEKNLEENDTTQSE